MLGYIKKKIIAPLYTHVGLHCMLYFFDNPVLETGSRHSQSFDALCHGMSKIASCEDKCESTSRAYTIVT